ncbi:MAG: hypothetical protein QOG03_438 [Actinomycetota bacterium]|jgi:hypothetical protein|nr:hypothetical protein [Actinomycetota bacterium]
MNLRRVRVLSGLVATLLMLSLFAGMTGGARGAAGSSAAPVTGGSWWWAEQPDPINNPGPAPVGQPAGNQIPPDVPEGDFVVAAKAGQVDKLSGLHIDTSAIPTGSTVSAFTLTLQEDKNANSLGGGTAVIKAYPAVDFFNDGSQARPTSEAPKYDVNGPSATAKLTTNGTWVFDLQAIVQAWASGTVSNNGIVIAPGSDPSNNFEVVWSGAQPPPVTDGAFIAPAGSTDSSGGFDSSASLGGSGGSLDSGAATTSINPDFTTPVSAPTPSGTPAAPPSVRPPQSVSLGHIGKVKRAPTLPFLLAIVAFGVLVAGCMIALGDAGEPVIERRGSVMRTLERRNPSSV